ncbi:MAG: TatD family hydrolase [bacterium]
MAMPKLELIDAHCHVNFSAYRGEEDGVIARAAAEGIGLVAVGSQSTTSQRAVECAEQHENVWAVIGLHPLHLFEQEIDESEEEGGELAHFRSRAEEFDPDFYRALIDRTPKVVGIGECGLDYYHVPVEVDSNFFRSRQEEVFRQQIGLAFERGLALMVHTRNAPDGSTDIHGDIRRILKDFRVEGRLPRFDIHCFSGSIAEAEAYMELGAYLSFTGNVTFKPRKVSPDSDETLHDVIQAVPLDRLLVETDAPYLTPVPHRGERNEPAYVRFVADKVAELKGVAAEEVYRRTLQNTRDLFRI